MQIPGSPLGICVHLSILARMPIRTWNSMTKWCLCYCSWVSTRYVRIYGQLLSTNWLTIAFQKYKDEWRIREKQKEGCCADELDNILGAPHVWYRCSSWERGTLLQPCRGKLPANRLQLHSLAGMPVLPYALDDWIAFFSLVRFELSTGGSGSSWACRSGVPEGDVGACGTECREQEKHLPYYRLGASLACSTWLFGGHPITWGNSICFFTLSNGCMLTFLSVLVFVQAHQR